MATRNADGVKVDVGLRDLDRALSTSDCQDLAGTANGALSTVDTTLANGVESFTFSFDPTLVSGNLVAFRWAAFGQAPPSPADAGPWDLLPDSAGSGLSVRMSAGIAFPDPPATPDPVPPGPGPPSPTSDTTRPLLSALSLSRTRFRAAVRTRVSYRLSEAASNSFSFMGRLRGRRLEAGRYRLRAVATDPAGNSSQAKYTRFRIVRR